MKLFCDRCNTPLVSKKGKTTYHSCRRINGEWHKITIRQTSRKLKVEL